MPSMRTWKLSQPPNYITNEDKKYPYSEVPYIGEYNLIKLPFSQALVEHIDYWGEGQITVVPGGVSGFKDSYNINHQYQLVSNGSDRDRKIPNRIPVISYTNCDTRAYVKDDSVKLVTVMGSPINRSCAQDIARIVNGGEGRVVVYGFDDHSADIRNLEELLWQKGLIFCQNYDLPETLLGLTLFDSHRAYVNKEELGSHLRNNIAKGNYENALKAAQKCIDTENQKVLVDSVNQLLTYGVKNVMTFAYKLWLADKNIVMDTFPESFKLIFNGDKVKIVSRLHNMPLKLDANPDSNSNRLAWGDGTDSNIEKLKWKFHSMLKNDKVVHDIENLEYSMMLRLKADSDSYGDRLCLGEATVDEKDSFKFTLEPVKKEDDYLFLIYNNEFKQYFKLDDSTDSNGNRKLWGNDYFVNRDYNRFGWHIVSGQ